MLLGLGDLTERGGKKKKKKKRRRIRDTFIITFPSLFSSLLTRSHFVVCLSTGGCITRRKATAVNTVANTSRTACG